MCASAIAPKACGCGCALRAHGVKALAVQTDVSIEADFASLRGRGCELGPVRGLMNNAGIVDLNLGSKT
jgi:NAD(P)-dependent dehydrogenase (short-subunit alcohol dehydrogenase family)